ncbi:type IV pilin protein [Halanaerobium salsuginis]|jgi:general secretion pathway protein G|uniref:General secretion pathway protein G n=1 Tax=Halanaerobium salsuginis TaxID=29563 RepID=A0A1I4EUD4_9FIRM|nr:prepilin-type N-terminal cleavage/methylation domain-containing protein [Halanaerobium salsuginis]SFL08929.1 general secretion pathway protein G [Halanaerobium salsuginis]
MSKLKELLNNNAGFTLIELLIVITILGILMSIAIPALGGIKSKANDTVAKADLHNIMQSLEIYYLENGEYPAYSSENTLDNVAELTDLKIKNDASYYYYQSDLGSNAQQYLIYFQNKDDDYYYISTAESSLAGPINSKPALDS